MSKIAQSASVLVLAVAATAILGGPALAQQARPGEQMGMRYLTWAGKPATPDTPADDLRRSGDVTPRQQPASAHAATPVARPSRYGAPAGNGLTPASAWTGRPTEMPAPRTTHQPAPAPQAPNPEPAPLQAAASAPEYDAGRSFRRQDSYYAAPPQVQMAMQPTPQPTYSVPPPVVVPTATEAADPMAPRADALIYRMGRDAPAPQQPVRPQPVQQQAAPHRLAQAAPTQANQPPREGARYYSVHREAGHEPDPLTLPESVFIGGGTTTDLAEPPPTPVTTRTVNGQSRVIVPNQDPTLP